MTDQHFDIAIIGAGPGGYSTALRAAELGKTVALIERDATMGGTCLNRGCIPSKALLTAAHSAQDVRRGERMGINATLHSIDFGKLKDFRISTVETMTKGLSGLLAHRGVTVFQGNGEPVDGNTIRITPTDACGQVLCTLKAGVPQSVGEQLAITAEHTILATGSKPLPLPNNPFSGAIIDSTQALELDTFPSSAVIVGSGAIALEFASLWNAAGCEVTLLIRKDRVLSAWDKRVSSTLTRELKRRGVTVITRSSVNRMQTGANLGVTVHYTQNESEEKHTAYGEIALVAIGRSPNTDSPWFAEQNIALDERGYVKTDAYGHTSRAHTWALGDITAGPALAHKAFAQGIVIAERIANLDSKPVCDETIPQVVFSFPEAACVGITLAEAKEREDIVNPEEIAYPIMANSRMLMSSEGGSMTLVTGALSHDPQTTLVLGAHIVAPNASDLIAEAQQIVGNKVPLSEAARLIHPHPTFSEMFGEALLKADGRPLHTR